MVPVTALVGACLMAIAVGFWLGLAFTGRAHRGNHSFHDPAVSVHATAARAQATHQQPRSVDAPAAHRATGNPNVGGRHRLIERPPS
ncbi:hypothetical protein [Amycolatopsis aidingensis]|uniref:hypothetical protein n=1 Tax=Amycolatopsis aidingensis TaxID=2842453 RepID=UPI001C0E5D81|nr:hypothetical protein [Amycolatopsis aidingensis]